MNFANSVKFFLNRARERLWVKPLFVSLVSVFAVFLAGKADDFAIAQALPVVSVDSIEKLLSLLSSSMLVIAVFAVGAMISAYSSASNSATPRSFSVVIADDVSQNALSTFIGAFIYSNIAIIALLNDYYGKAGHFVLFLMTLVVFVFVVLSFVRWVDRIARLGRMGSTINKVERATANALTVDREYPTLGAKRTRDKPVGSPVFSNTVGYIQRINIAALQDIAERHQTDIFVIARPGAFISPGQALVYIANEDCIQNPEFDESTIQNEFVTGDDRTFDEDPRFGLIVLSEIASRALSPAVNDPGTAINIIGTFVRLFTNWSNEEKGKQENEELYKNIFVPELKLEDMIEDAFGAISRDGASLIEVDIRLQKAFFALSELSDEMKPVVMEQARYAIAHAKNMLKLDKDVEKLKSVSAWLT